MGSLVRVRFRMVAARHSASSACTEAARSRLGRTTVPSPRLRGEGQGEGRRHTLTSRKFPPLIPTFSP